MSLLFEYDINSFCHDIAQIFNTDVRDIDTPFHRQIKPAGMRKRHVISLNKVCNENWI